MSDLHDRRALPIQFTEEFHDFLGLSGMQIASRLVGQQQRGLMNHRARNSHQLLLTARKLARGQVFLGDDLKTVENIRYQALPLAPGNIFVREWQVNVLPHSEVVEQMITLKNDPDVSLG